MRDSVVMRDVEIGEGAVIEYSIIDSGVKIGKGAKIGESKENADGIAVIGVGLEIPENMSVKSGLMVNEAKLCELINDKEEN